MTQDHIFISANFDVSANELMDIAVIRTDKRGKPMAAFATKIDDNISFRAMREMVLDNICKPSFSDKFVVVGYNSDYVQKILDKGCRTLNLEEFFAGKVWVDLYQLAWPLLYSGLIPGRSLHNLGIFYKAKSDGVKSVESDCALTAEIYFKMMRQLRAGVSGENFLSELGGDTLESLRSIIGI